MPTKPSKPRGRNYLSRLARETAETLDGWRLDKLNYKIYKRAMDLMKDLDDVPDPEARSRIIERAAKATAAMAETKESRARVARIFLEVYKAKNNSDATNINVQTNVLVPGQVPRSVVLDALFGSGRPPELAVQSNSDEQDDGANVLPVRLADDPEVR